MNYGNLHRASKYINKKFGGNFKAIYSRGRALAGSYRAGEFAELVDHVADVASRNAPVRLLDNEGHFGPLCKPLIRKDIMVF